MDRSGEITVFLAMILVSVCALLCGLAESVRTAGARCYLRMAADSSVDSLMAQYHRELWRRYRILGLEYDSPKTLEREMAGFLAPYLEAENWYPMKLSQVQAEDITTLTEGNGRYMEQEILDYMKYGLLDTDWDELDEAGAVKLYDTWKEGESVNRVSGLYSSHSKEAVRVEKALEQINARLDSQQEHWLLARDCLEEADGAGFIAQAGKVIKELEKLPGLVTSYEKQADRLKEQLIKSREQFEDEADHLTPGVREALEDEITQYEAYVDQDGIRRREIVGLREYGPARSLWIRDVVTMAEEVMDYIDSWEPDDEDDELDEDALWEPVRSLWAGYAMLSLGIQCGVKDKEKEGLLEKVGDFVSGSLLELTLPEGAAVSGKSLSLKSVPSALWSKGGGSGNGEDKSSCNTGSEGSVSGNSAHNGLAGDKNLLLRLRTGEYAIRYFRGFEKEPEENVFYELEYLIEGNSRDRDNLSGVVARLTAMRGGLNLIHIISDSQKRQEARSLALAIVGGSGILPLVSVTAFLIMSMWALGEALMDVRDLLDGGRVPVLKTRDDWKLNLEDLLDIGRNRRLRDTGITDCRSKGPDYKGYIRILIFGGYGPETIYRMMDIMQINIGREQKGFSMESCACKVETKTIVSGKHVFFSTALWKSQMGGSGFDYVTAMAASGSYLDDSASKQ